MTISNGDFCDSSPAAVTGGEMANAVVPELDEAALAAALANDLDGAFELFVIAYRQCIVNFIARMLRDDARAEDVAQDVFVRAYRALGAYSPERRAALRLRAWTYAIAHNLTRNAVRDAPAYMDSLDSEGAERAPASIDPQPGPEMLALRRETWDTIARAIDQLSPRLRPAYVMRYLHDLTYEEIAHALRQPVGTVKASAHRAALAVRSHLEHDHV